MNAPRKDLPVGTVCRVLEAAGATIPEKARNGNKAEMSCVFPDAHAHGDRNKSAYVDPRINAYGCATCFPKPVGAKKLAEALGVDWPRILEDVLGPRTGAASGTKPAEHAAESADAWRIGKAFTAQRLADGTEDPALTYAEGRGLRDALTAEAEAEPLAVIFPADGAGLPEPYARMAREGYRLAARLLDVRTGALASIQARFVGNDPPNLGPKIRTPYGGRVAGCAYMNAPALALVHGKATGTARLIFGEGLADFCTLALALPADPVACIAGTENVEKVLGRMNGDGPPAWLREGLDLVNALDVDDAGEKASEKVLTLARAAGVKVRRVTWPDGCKDAGDVLRAHGLAAVAHAVDGAREKVTRFLESFEWAPDLLAREVEKPRSLLGDGLLNAGDFALLYGPPGAGKTWTALSLALALASGKEWLGIAGSGTPLRVGYFAMELPAYHLRERLARLVELMQLDGAPATLATLSRPGLKGAVDLVQEDHAGELLDFCRTLALDLVILDPLSRVHTADERDAVSFARVLAELERVRLDTGTALALVHHNRKQQGGQKAENVLDEIRGTSRLASDPTLIMRLAPHRGLAELSFPKPNFAAPPDSVYLKRLEAGGYEVTDSPKRAEEARKDKLTAALAAIREAGADGIKPADLAARVGVKDRTVRDYVKALETDGTVLVIGKANRTRYVAAPQVRHASEHAGLAPDLLQHVENEDD